MRPTNITKIAEVIGAKVLGSGDLAAHITGVSTDSRSIAKSQCFVAIAGKNFDGHEYIATALSAGAACAISGRSVQPGPRDRPAGCRPDRGHGRSGPLVPAQLAGQGCLDHRLGRQNQHAGDCGPCPGNPNGRSLCPKKLQQQHRPAPDSARGRRPSPSRLLPNSEQTHPAKYPILRISHCQILP